MVGVYRLTIIGLGVGAIPNRGWSLAKNLTGLGREPNFGAQGRVAFTPWHNFWGPVH